MAEYQRSHSRAATVAQTDGRHVLIQAGFTLPWTDDALLPANGLLGCKTLDLGEPVGVGRSTGWIGFQMGNWVVMVAEQKEGRWPKIDDIIPKVEAAKSRLELTAADAEFLAETLPHLPSDDAHYDPITLELNDRSLIRSKEEGATRPTQIELPTSRFIGEPVVLHSNRRYLAEALRLGFRTLHCFGPESPVLCADDRRRFLWCLLDGKSAIPRHADPICIEPPIVSAPRSRRIHSPEVPVTVPLRNSNQVAASASRAQPQVADTPAKRARPTASVVEQTIALRDALRQAARQAGDLAKAVRHQKRQARIFESTLASLKELQRVAG